MSRSTPMGAPSLGFHTLSQRRMPSKEGPHHSSHTYVTYDNYRPSSTGGSSATPHAMTNEAMITRRCDYLEKSEKALKESVKETVSERKRLQKDVQGKTRAMYDEMQWVYAKTTKAKLMGRVRASDEDSVVVADRRGAKVILVYPMKQRVTKTADDAERTEFMMRCKTVDPHTAQLAIHWVVVQDAVRSKDGKVKATKYVDGFSLV